MRQNIDEFIHTHYDDYKKESEWLQGIETTAITPRVSETMAKVIDYMTMYPNITVQKLKGVRSGRDVVSNMGWHDFRKRLDKTTIQLVQVLYEDEADQKYVLRWIVRGMTVYQAVLRIYADKGVVNETYQIERGG